MFGLHVAPMTSGAAFDGDPATRLADAVQRAGAVVCFERGEWPIGVSKHVDAALGTDEDGEIRGIGSGLSSGLCGVQYGFGVLEEAAHTELIGLKRATFEEKGGVTKGVELCGVDYQGESAELATHGIERIDEIAAIRGSDAQVVKHQTNVNRQNREGKKEVLFHEQPGEVRPVHL
jgi:hypothetical protein